MVHPRTCYLEKVILFVLVLLGGGGVQVAQAHGIRSSEEGGSTSFVDTAEENGKQQGDRLQQHTTRKLHQEEEIRTDTRKNRSVVLAGIIDDGAKISTEGLDFLVNLNCLQGVMTHVLVRTNDKILHELHNLVKTLKYSFSTSSECADLHITTQPRYISSSYKNRVEKLQHAREHQRTEIEGLLLARSNYHNVLSETVIIVADLDLEEFPLPGQVLQNAFSMISSPPNKTVEYSSPSLLRPDVMCAAGTVKTFANSNIPDEGYYDIFATILLPDTFVYPVHPRKTAQFNPTDDPSLVIGSNFTNVDLLHWFYDKARKSFVDNDEGYAIGQQEDHHEPMSYSSNMMLNPVPVLSCFGGLALYRASKWLHPQCSYLQMDPTNDKYSIRKEQKPCEHVILHRCLKEVENNTVITVQPDLRTRWIPNNAAAMTPSYAIAKFPWLMGSLHTTAITPSIASNQHMKKKDDSGTSLLSHRSDIGTPVTKRRRVVSPPDTDLEDAAYWSRQLGESSMTTSESSSRTNRSKKRPQRHRESRRRALSGSASTDWEDAEYWSREMSPLGESSMPTSTSKSSRRTSRSTKSPKSQTSKTSRRRAISDSASTDWEDTEYWSREMSPLGESSMPTSTSKSSRRTSRSTKSPKSQTSKTSRRRAISATTVSDYTEDEPMNASPKEVQRPDGNPQGKSQGRLQEPGAKTAFLHVGPRKTGSSSIQDALDIFFSEIALDSFNHNYFVSPMAKQLLYRESSVCDAKVRQGLMDEKPFMDRIKSLTVQGSNIFFSNENLDDTECVDVERIRNLFPKKWDVHIIMTYRRFYSWIASVFGQEYRTDVGGGWNRWDQLNNDGKPIGGLVDFVDMDWIEHMFSTYSGSAVYQFYQEGGFQTTVLNYEATDDIVESLFCLKDIHMKHTCNAIRAQNMFNHKPSMMSNVGISVVYDEIAMAAYQEGLLSSISRPEARKAIQVYHGEQSKNSSYQLPMKCLSVELMDMLLDITLKEEEMLFGSLYETKAELIATIAKDFDQNYKKKLCSPDTTKVLEDPSWRSFLSNLGGTPIME